ncbi:palmitoyltransferase akr1 [Elasticomyces elasticus]|uniref:Palmitoyltransferase n=1 Tax=Exophiala sideris TaxID=1016849 RepID=A0ABR0JKR8_9EURO|nr:palmitoyltransferase akr1 [Elasticomyces elasticus]KAK5032185.1 palmitoyltransferase akr1 [Exophiala sideris]KAK5036183.1 palmitoyltransferase akr1 [Exophiala sideris]KAK5066566.1 palmitoyltransferase akr1 [Exophiala sideris]KAK5180388.1 palmitoyltransferase akr1 [Eurotiomycetes sp. CCFEE 6388]
MSSPASQKLSHPPTTKSNATSPQVTLEDVELAPMQNGQAEPSLPLEEDIMQCARIGALEHIQKMIQSGKYDAKYKDEEGITPLHWAAINNQFAVCKYLLEQGADVNAKGGESNATAVMWASQRCHFYIVNLLLQNGADPLLTDGQGYNILHLATIDGNALLLILLLHQNIPVDIPDPQGHTSLMWAGYKGWPACVDLLLRWGANVKATDDNGYTPLHWALVKGSKPCLDKLLEYGADRFAKTNEGKTPNVCADEMNTKRAYMRSLSDHGYDASGNVKTLPLNLHNFIRDRSKMSKFFFFYPFVIMVIGLYIISHLNIFIGLPIFLVACLGMQYGAQRIALHGPLEYHTIHKTPYLAGIFAGTLFWVGFSYLTIVLSATLYSNFFSNIFFAVSYASTAYFYFQAMVEDPGWIPKLVSRNQQRAAIEELFSLWKFDEENFCVQCMVRKPLRSKHCRRCHRCVAKQDHHCPWIHNCVGNNNIRHFYIYILSLEVGIILYVRLVLSYLSLLPAPTDDAISQCHILGPSLCNFVLRDPWTVALTFWAVLQLVWVTMLIVVQTVQISKNQTTYENMKRHEHSHDHKPLLPQHARPVTQGASAATTSLNDTAAASTRINPVPRRPDGFFTRWKKLLGLDAFLATASDASHGKLQSRNANPFTRGVIGNCKDFWCDPAPIFGKRENCKGYLGGEVVDYAHLYEVPLRLRRGAGGMAYTSVATDDDHEEV